MRRDVMIHVLSLQRGPQGENTIDFTTKGQLIEDETKDMSSLVYQEPSSGMEGVETTLEINSQEEIITLLRKGAIQSQQIFKKDERNYGTYHTPYGQFLMETSVQQLELALERDQGSLFLKYELSLNNNPISGNRLIITYKYDE